MTWPKLENWGAFFLKDCWWSEICESSRLVGKERDSSKKTACPRLCGGKHHGEDEAVSKGLWLGKESEEKSGKQNGLGREAVASFHESWQPAQRFESIS